VRLIGGGRYFPVMQFFRFLAGMQYEYKNITAKSGNWTSTLLLLLLGVLSTGLTGDRSVSGEFKVDLAH
jgi:hypothetical protein